MKNYWKRFLAMFRFSLKAVCEMSTEAKDYHDYPDDIDSHLGVAGPGHIYT